jgi:hypothetical protein
MVRQIRLTWLLTIAIASPTFSFVGRAEAAAVKVWATDNACPALKPAVEEIARVPFPDIWTVVIACNDMKWEMLQRKADAQATNNAFTNVEGRITVVRGGLFLRNTVGRPAHRVLLHEIGHIQCNCGDEGKAERWALDHELANQVPKK